MYKKTKTNYGKNMFKYESKHFFLKSKTRTQDMKDKSSNGILL
jgi:hypothetical protein